MSCRAKTNSAWFNAAKDGDLQYIQTNKQKYAKSYDSRETDINNNILGGYAAIHYAAMYGQKEIVKELLPMEFTLLTKNQLAVTCPGFSEKLKFKIQPQSTCLSVALLRNNTDVAEEIYEYLTSEAERKKEFLAASQGLVFNTAIVASLCENCLVSQKVLDDEDFVMNELLTSRKGELTAAMNGAYFFRLPVTLKLKQLMDEGKGQAELAELLLMTDKEGNTALQCSLNAKIDVESFQVKSENVGRIQQLFQVLTARAIDFAKQSNSAELQALAKAFEERSDAAQLLGTADAKLQDGDAEASAE